MNAFTQKADVSWVKKADTERRISRTMSQTLSEKTTIERLRFRPVVGPKTNTAVNTKCQ
jgi:hypothetical protein